MKSILAVGLLDQDRASLQEILTSLGWEVRIAPGRLDTFQHLRRGGVAAVVCQSGLADGDWKDVLAQLHLCCPQPQLIVATRFADRRLSADVVSFGGLEVLSTPFEREELTRAILHAALRSRVQAEQRESRQSAAQSNPGNRAVTTASSPGRIVEVRCQTICSGNFPPASEAAWRTFWEDRSGAQTSPES